MSRRPAASPRQAALAALPFLALGGAAAAALLLPGAATAQEPVAMAVATPPAVAADPAWDSAYYAWDAGDYPEALARMERLLSGPNAERYLARVALLTGELHPTVELTPDGAEPRWSPDGRYAAYETTREGETVTVVVEPGAAGVREVAVLDGTGAVLGPGGQAAWLRVEVTPELAAARGAYERLRAANDPAWREQRAEVAQLEAEATLVMAATLPAGRARAVPLDGVTPSALAYHQGSLHVFGEREGVPATLAVLVGGSAPAAGVEGARGLVAAGPSALLQLDRGAWAVLPASGTAMRVTADAAALSADGSTLATLAEGEGGSEIRLQSLATAGAPARAVYTTANPVTGLAVSPTGRRVAFQEMLREDWEILVVEEGADPLRVTTDIQHDLYPAFLSESTLLTIKGEGRHRRSYLQDLETGTETRLFHNNTVRTVAPEYQWAPSPDGTKLLVQAERDGDTVSPERGVYLMDLSTTLGVPQVLARVRAARAAEEALRAWGAERFAAIDEDVRAATADVSTGRIFRYAEDLHAFGSKNITQPGNAPATRYLADRLRSFGYEPELQWFEARGVRVANVIARLPGTEHPEVVYALSSHFDSNARGPGADDNSSGTTALLEAARVMKDRPQHATIEFLFFNGEESGLLGSREWVRQAVASGKGLVGALNNDMVGFANDHRLDNTIRYSNPGIRDIQHAAAFLFTDLITYDALYYKSTDAQAYYDAYGDIVGGIGSYPILASPHYHQSHDVLETINQQLVAEVAKTTVATLMLLADVPSRVKDVVVAVDGTVTWEALPEDDIREYVVVVNGGERPDPATGRRVTGTSVRLDGVAPGDEIAVIAVDERGRPGWDWARVTVGGN